MNCPGLRTGTQRRGSVSLQQLIGGQLSRVPTTEDSRVSLTVHWAEGSKDALMLNVLSNKDIY